MGATLSLSFSLFLSLQDRTAEGRATQSHPYTLHHTSYIIYHSATYHLPNTLHPVCRQRDTTPRSRPRLYRTLTRPVDVTLRRRPVPCTMYPTPPRDWGLGDQMTMKHSPAAPTRAILKSIIYWCVVQIRQLRLTTRTIPKLTLWAHGTNSSTAAEREGNNLEGFKDFCLKYGSSQGQYMAVRPVYGLDSLTWAEFAREWFYLSIYVSIYPSIYLRIYMHLYLLYLSTSISSISIWLPDRRRPRCTRHILPPPQTRTCFRV